LTPSLIYKDDYSFIAPDSGDSLHPEYSDSLLDNMKIVVRDTSGAVISGIEPDSAAIKKMALSYCSAYSMERANWDEPDGNTLTQPTLALVNEGSNVVENAHLYYFFATSGEPVVTADLQEKVDKATVYLDIMGHEDTLNRYAVHIAYRGIELHPEDRINGINFEIRNSDGSLWNYQADPSFLCSDTSLCDDTLVYNANILILDDEGNRLGGMHPGDFSSDTGSMTDIILEASDSSSDYVSRPKVRILNSGDDTLQSFRIYYYFEVERGSHVSLGVPNPPVGCTVNLEQLVGSKYRLVYACSNVNVFPNDTFPGIAGITVELRQYNISGNYNFWDRNNDYSAQGLDSGWRETENIVVKDLEGNIVWGIEP
jgi:hypothetical protein